MKVQGLVPPCTTISRGTGLSGTAMYLIVPISLPCTALYCHVSRRGQEDTRRYDSVCTRLGLFSGTLGLGLSQGLLDWEYV